jgi:TfoX/Sxy family transcriptional regulator of competence genes
VAYDEGLAQRVRETLAANGGAIERRMFGGLAFMIQGHMTAGVQGSELVARVGRDVAAELLLCDHVRAMDFTGKPLPGYLYVASEALESDATLDAWLNRCLAHTASLPER